MIRIIRAAVAMSIQDQGRYGHRAEGHARSGAMDQLSLRLTNRLAGASESAAGVEIGPGPCVIEVTAAGTIAFGGARREGALWWETLEARKGDQFELGDGSDGVWSYLSIAGGVDSPIYKGSRSTHVGEGIGSWLRNGDLVSAADDATDPAVVDPPDMQGMVRLFGELQGPRKTGGRGDRMGYELEGNPEDGGSAEDWSEPLLPGCIQVPPGGKPIVLMAEAPTVGGYSVPAVVHSEDLRLIAQSRPGAEIEFNVIGMTT